MSEPFYYYDALTSSHHQQRKYSKKQNATLERQYQRQLRRRMMRQNVCFTYRQYQQLPRSMVVCVIGLVVVACGVVLLGSGVPQTMSSSSSPTTSAPSSPGAVMEQYAAAIATATSSSSSVMETDERAAVIRPSQPLHSITEQHSTPSQNSTMPVWLSDYLEFDTTAITMSSNSNTDAPILQWTCVGGGCGGLGDRMLGIAQTFLIAVCNRRVFVVDDDDKHQQTPILVAKRWKRRGLIPDPLHVVIDDRTDPFWKDPTLDAATQPFLALKTNLWTGDQFWSSPCWQRLVGDDESNMRTDPDALLRVVLDQLFEWPSETVATGQQWLTDIQQEHQQYPWFIGVHIRTGRLDHSTDLFHPQVPAMLDCARSLMQHCQHSNAISMVYVATDDAQLRADVVQRDPTTITTMDSLDVQHSYSTSRRTSYSASAASLVELWMLSTQTACVVTTPQSKFSYVAGIWAGCRVETSPTDEDTVCRVPPTLDCHR